MARRDSRGVRLYTRNGYNFGDRFRRIVEAVANLPVRSCLIDKKTIVVDDSGLPVFELLRYRHHDHAALLCAVDLIELDGNDLRRPPVEERRGFLGEALQLRVRGDLQARPCAGLRGIVSKRLGSLYRSCRELAEAQQPCAPAVRRERKKTGTVGAGCDNGFD
jgi:bifunctional non-homologous end joining protein LigD